jgi:hypothetical protein
MTARQRLAQQCGEGEDVRFFEQHGHRRHRARAALPFEFGHDRPATAIVRLRPDNTTQRAPIEADRTIPDVEGLVAHLWQAIDFQKRFHDGAPISLPISDDLIVQFLKERRHG